MSKAPSPILGYLDTLDPGERHPVSPVDSLSGVDVSVTGGLLVLELPAQRLDGRTRLDFVSNQLPHNYLPVSGLSLDTKTLLNGGGIARAR